MGKRRDSVWNKWRWLKGICGGCRWRSLWGLIGNDWRIWRRLTRWRHGRLAADVDFSFKFVCYLCMNKIILSSEWVTHLFVRFAPNTRIAIHWLHWNWQQYPPNTGNSGCTLALWEMPKLNIILEYNVIVYSGWMLPIWMKIAFEMSICTDCIS